MPAYVAFIRIDWHVDEASEALRQQLPAANDDLDSTDHTFETFEQRLTLFAEAHRDAHVDALLEDGYRIRWFLHARDGKVTVRDAYPALAEIAHDGAIAGIDVEYDSEAALIAAVDRASNALAAGTTVVDVGWERYLVQLAGGGANVHKVYPADRVLFERLAHEEYPPPARAAREPEHRYGQALYMPEDMLQFLQDQATRCDRSVSFLVQAAWKLTRTQIAVTEEAALRAVAHTFEGDKRKQTLYFPGDILDAIEREAARLGSSLSLVAQSAVALARTQLANLPQADNFPAF